MTLLEEIRRVADEATCLYTHDETHQAIQTMAQKITAELHDAHPIILTVLNGGIFFAGELLLHLPFPLEVDSVKAGRYQGATAGTTMTWTLRPSLSLKDRTVLVVDDILDEGITLSEIIRYCEQEGAKAIFSAVLVDKRIGKEKPHTADFVGLVTENHYLFGYGLDYKNHLRNWPGIYACQTVY